MENHTKYVKTKKYDEDFINMYNIMTMTKIKKLKIFKSL